MASRRNGRSVSRKDAPISPPKASSSAAASASATSPDVSSQNKRATRSSSRNITAAQHQLQNIDQVLGPVEEEFDEQPSDGPGDDESLSSTGSHLQSELNELDRDAIINNLVILHDDATALLSLFQGYDNDDDGLDLFCEKLSTPNSPQRRRFQVRENRLLSSREAYGDLDFIQSDLILRKVANTLEIEALNQGPWRPDPILYIANLALQMITVFSTSSEDRHTYLQYMFNNFPTPFAGKHSFPVGRVITDETIDMSIDILTQFYIQTAMTEEASPSFDPDILARKIFWDDKDQARGFLHPNTLLKVIERVEVLRKFFKTKPRTSIDVSALRERFPWSQFVLQVVKWSLARYEELQASINARGGIDTISDLLVAGDLSDHENTGAATVKTPEQEPAVPARRVALLEPAEIEGSPQKLASGRPTGRSLKAMVSRLRDLKTEYAVRSSGAHTEVVVEDQPEQMLEIPPSPTPEETNEGGPADEPDPPKQSTHMAKPQVQEDDLVMTQQTRIVMETIRRQQEQSEKENRDVTTKKRSLLDRQANAEKVEWSEATEDPTPPKRIAPHTTPPLDGSESDEDEDDDEDEDEFETDDRAAKRPRMDVEGSGRQYTSSRPQPPASSPPAPSSIQQTRVRSTLQPIPAPRAPSSTPAANRPREPSPFVSEVALVNEEAKRQARLSREVMRRPDAQVRIPYNEDEIGRLMEMVELHGTMWSTILDEDAKHEDGPRLQGRSQVQLKDKARNIKLDFLKARRRLPPGFEKVSIGNRQIDLLRQLGINYIEGQRAP